MPQPNCQHTHFHAEHRTHTECRYIPSSWGPDDPDDPYETVVLTDTLWICDDCGEILDVDIAD